MKRKFQPNQERWVKIFHRILNTPAFIELSYSARALYLDMRMLLTGSNNGNICATLGTLRHRGWSSPTTLAKCLRELEAVGLIAKTRKTVGVENGAKLCNLYRFTDEACFEFSKQGIPMMTATNDYAKIKTRTEAKALLRAARAPQRKKKDATKAGRSASHSGGNDAVNDTDTGQSMAVNL